MVLVGLTGSIGTGKSTVAGMLAELGAVVIDTDELARRAVARGSEGLARVASRFGRAVIGPSGELDRAALRRLIFSDPKARRDLEAIIHPIVLARQEELVAAAAENPDAVVVVDIPLLFEVGWEDRFDLVIVVYADRQTQLERLTTRDGVRPEEAGQALAAQIDIETKRARADFVIDNRGPLAETRDQVRHLYGRLKRLAADSKNKH